MSIEIDIVDQATIRHDGNGITATRRAIITGITGPPAQRARNALEARGLPRYGDPHPAIPNLKCADVILEALDTNKWSGTLIYREPSPGDRAQMAPIGTVADVEWYSATVTVERYFDNSGSRLFHWYSGNPKSLRIVGGRIIEITAGRSFAVKNERANVQIPSAGVRVLIPEVSPPRGRLHFIGTVNRAPWSGFGPRSWLFLGPSSGRLEKGRWLNTYELLYRSDKWDLNSIVEFQGGVPSDATIGNGIVNFRVYAEENFNALGFSV